MSFVRSITLSILFMLLAALPSLPTNAEPSNASDTPYESNDSCDQAGNIPANNNTQKHTFDVAGDVDWVYFNATAGTKYRIEVTVPIGSSADVEPALYHSCDTLPADVPWSGTFRPDARLIFTADQSGLVYLRFVNLKYDIYGEDVNYELSVRPIVDKPQNGALIVLAGRLKEDDRLQENIHNVTDRVYRTFQGYGYSDDDIYYLATDPGLTGYDAPANIENLRIAITEWAMERLGNDSTLTIYIMDHGDEDTIYLDNINEQILTPGDLDTWLTTLENAKPNLEVNIILEACYMGSFIEGDTSISKEGRVVITSTSKDARAYASRNGAHFSDIFLTALGQGRDFSDSFIDARDFVKEVIFLQIPWLDANGNGTPNELDDGAIAARRSFVYIDTESDNKWHPYIASVAGETFVNTSRGRIQAEIRDDGQIENVWAVIYPPSYTPPQESHQEELIDEELEIVALNSMGNDLFSANYNAFNEAGSYRFVIYAEDNEGLIAHPAKYDFVVEVDPNSTPTETSSSTDAPAFNLTATDTPIPPTATLLPTSSPTTVPTPAPTQANNNSLSKPMLADHCSGGLPTGPQQEAGCLVGLVYMDGHPMADIDVQIQNRFGQSKAIKTKIYPGRETRPYYHFDLANLSITTGQTFIVTVEHNGQIQQIRFIAKPGLQQVDIVLSSENQTDPIATINHLPGYRILQSQALMADGIGQSGVNDVTMINYRWRSNRHEEDLGSSPTLSLAPGKLDIGPHILSLEVQDSNGNWSAPSEANIYVASDGEPTWTLLLYLGGDYHDGGKLHRKFQRALHEIANNLDSQNVQVAALLDGPEDGDTQRWLIRNSSDVDIDDSFCGKATCEAATDDPDSLADFLLWAQKEASAEHYYLVIADHGQAVQGIAWDTTSDLVDGGGQNDSAYLKIQELGQALRYPGVQPVDILHLDACSMNLLETAFELQDRTDVMISSQYLGWDYFAYDQYMDFFDGSSVTAKVIAQKIVQHYANLAEDDERPYTISALDMAFATDILATVSRISEQLIKLIDDKELDDRTLDEVRKKVQNFDSNGDRVNDEHDYYIDLLDWSTQLTSVVDDRELKRRAAEFSLLLVDFIIENSSGSYHLPARYANGRYIDLERANGLSVFYPMSYESEVYSAYINHELFSFTHESSWPQFLQGLGEVTGEGTESLLGPLSHLETQNAILYLPLIMR